MDLFLSPDVIDLAGGDCKNEEGDDHDEEPAAAAAALGDFDSFLLGRDDIVIDLAGGDNKSEEGDDHEEAPAADALVGDFDSFLLGRDDISFIYSHQEEVFTESVLDQTKSIQGRGG